LLVNNGMRTNKIVKHECKSDKLDQKDPVSRALYLYPDILLSAWFKRSFSPSIYGYWNMFTKEDESTILIRYFSLFYTEFIHANRIIFVARFKNGRREFGFIGAIGEVLGFHTKCSAERISNTFFSDGPSI